jgi:hypothetical protein
MERTIDDSRATGRAGRAAAGPASALAALEERIAPVTAAGERTMAVPPALADLLPEAGLVRGRALACRGAAATWVAMMLAAPSVAGGSWLGVIDVPELGLDAAAETGIALERIVRIDTGGVPSVWADSVAAACDGFEILLTSLSAVGGRLTPATARKVLTRVRQRAAVLLVLGEHGPLECDGVIEGIEGSWSGLGVGHGHLRQRHLRIAASGRRIPGVRRCTVELPLAAPSTTAVPTDEVRGDPADRRPSTGAVAATSGSDVVGDDLLTAVAG